MDPNQNTYNAPFNHLDQIQNYLGLILYVVLVAALDAYLFTLFKRKAARIGLVACQTLVMVFWLFGLTLPLIGSVIVMIVGSSLLFLANINETRDFIANNMVGKVKGKLLQKKKSRPEALFDRELVYRKVETAVISMSKQKVGAIITFEKKDSLDDLMKTGTIINAPVTPELLQTIFYPGTRLHDGAVIIRNDIIAAASVYYTPTTRPLTGKFGSRHRAAIGVSEACDAVTVVVSEETGRISIAHQGELRTVNPDAFLSTLEDYMNVKESSNEEEK